MPAQVCVIEPGQPYNRKLSPDHTAQMINFAVRRPHMNAESITRDGPGHLGLGTPVDAKLQGFHIGLDNEGKLITVNGRVLKGPQILYMQAKGPKTTSVEPRFGGWNMQNIKFMEGSTMPTNWAFFRITNQRSREYNVAGVARNLAGMLATVGLRITTPGTTKEVTVQQGQYGFDFSNLENAFATAEAGKVRFIFICMPDKNTDVYNKIKQLGDIKHGIHTVCVAEPTLVRNEGPREAQLLANLALKVNLKLGGTNQMIDTRTLPLLAKNNTMFVGIDVTHPSPGSSKEAPSVAAMVASINNKLGQWPAAIRVQKGKQEKVNDLEEMLLSRLDLWQKLGKNASLPENILVYRDGVSEGQYGMVLKDELPNLRDACKKRYPPAMQARGLPRISIAIVGKRHHTRFYPTTEQGSDGRTGNCQPGTVVDRGVTQARNWDFYLQAHTALQGTARPAHYYMVYDEIFTGDKPEPVFAGKNKADELEQLTMASSHVFGRATKVISTVAAARYADMVCERARAYLTHLFDAEGSSDNQSQTTSATGSTNLAPVVIHENLANTMFYV